jgi:hypothetical protein
MAAIARRGSMVEVHRRSRAAAVAYMRADEPSQRAEWLVVVRMYQRSVLAAKRREHELLAAQLEQHESMRESMRQAMEARS